MPDTRVQNEAVEVIAAWHCNIRCESCAFASPAQAVRFADPKTVATDLTSLAAWLEVEHVRILGGEPLLHPRFLDLVKAIRRSRIGETIRVVTNGLPLLKIPPDIWAAVDEIHISQYPNAKPFIERHIDTFRARCEAAGTRLTVKHYDYFRYSFRKPGEEPGLTQRIYATCQMAHVWRSLTAENGRLYRCLQSAYIQDAADYERHRSEHGEDYLTIRDIRSAAELEAWLNRKPALKSCAVCAGSVGRRHAHRQLAPKAGDTLVAGMAGIDADYLEALERSIVDDNECVMNILEYTGAR
jgi:organic radical activating enzyme